jgi:hypothetical protein
METVSLALDALALYGAAGLLFALAFLSVGIAQVDPAARGSSLAFRLLLLPGVVAFWPFLLLRWLASRRGTA